MYIRRNPQIWIGTIFLLLLPLSNLFGQQKLLFRYNSDYDPASELNSDVSINEVSVSESTEDEDEVARGVDGWGYNAIKTSYFSSDSSYILSDNNVSLSLFGNLDLSGEMWVKLFSNNGTLLAWDDTSKLHGFNLFVQNGILTFRSRIVNEIYEIETQTALELLKWYSINWFCMINDDTIEQAVYLDGERIANNKEALRSIFGFVVLNAPVSIGFSFQENLPVGNFSGEIYAANLKNYIPGNTYLTGKIPYDGSAYSGIPSYHDYAIDSIEDNRDERLTPNETQVDETVFVPYLNDEFIPQGISNSFEDESYSESEGMIYISMYHKTPAGVIRTKRSIVVEIDPQDNYQVRRCFRLRGTLQTGHNGGIAYKDNSIYVASANTVEVYELPAYAGAGAEKYQDLYTTLSKLFSVQSKASFMTYQSDSVWVGDYRTSSQQDPYLYGYPLDAEGNIITAASPRIYRLPYQTQGVAWRYYEGRKYLFISRSGGDTGSFIYRCRAENLSLNNIPVIDATFNIPAGGEDLSFNNSGQLLNVSESGAKYFQKRSSPWTSFYPFIFTISEDVLFEGVVTSVEEENPGLSLNIPKTFDLSAYPNPFNSQLTILYSLKRQSSVDIRIYNLLGQEVNKFIGSDRQNAGSHSVKWNASGFPSGIYIIEITVDGSNRESVKTLLLR